MRLSLYLHIPFCKSKCVYCDFCSFAADEAAMERYCASLMREIELASAEYAGAQIETVYIGGGTPSVLPAALMRKVLAKLKDTFTINPGVEFTSEANPGTVGDAWLEATASAGMNRLSLGMQAGQNRLLSLLGRIHRINEVYDTLSLARRHGVHNLSVDLMYGLPTQTLQEYLDSIRTAADLGVQHISAYALKVEEGTKLERMIEAGELQLPDEDLAADMMEAGVELLEKLGYQRYEISNFAQPGYASRHNLVYWRQGYYLGLGLNAASMLPYTGAAYLRRTNLPAFAAYHKALVEGRLPIAESLPVNREEAMFETMMLGLRTTAGVSFASFEAMHGRSLPGVYADAIAQLRGSGWLQPVDLNDPRLALNARGLAMQNTALMAFLTEK